MSQYGNKKYANTHKPSDFDSSEPVRYNQSRTGSTQTMTVCKNQATVRLYQAREGPHMTLTSDFRRRKVARRKGNPMKNLTKGIAAVGALAMLTGVGAMMACLVVAIVPIIIFYLCCQKYIIKGVMAGAVKG